MSDRTHSVLGLVTAGLIMGSAVAVLNLGAPNLSSAAARCKGGGSPSPSPSPSASETSQADAPVPAQTTGTPSPSGSASPSPSRSSTFPPPLPTLPLPSGSQSPSPTPTKSGGASARCPTRVTIEYDAPGPPDPKRAEFSGAVKSPQDECESGRRVILKKERSGKDQTVSRTVSNARGKWSVQTRGSDGTFYAVAPKERTATDEGPVVCEEGRSKSLKV